MKQYKLLKDLPTWKAGRIFSILEDWCLYGTTEDNELVMVYSAVTLVNFWLLKNNEWFEEIIEEEKTIFNLKYWDKVFCTYAREIKEEEYTGSAHFYYKAKYWELFLTEDEAIEELNKKEAIYEIKKFCYENWVELLDKNSIIYNWENKYRIKYEAATKEFYKYWYCFSDDSICFDFVFLNQEDVELVINECYEYLRILYLR